MANVEIMDSPFETEKKMIFMVTVTGIIPPPQCRMIGLFSDGFYGATAQYMIYSAEDAPESVN